MNNPFSVGVAPESREDDLDLNAAPLIDYPAMRPGRAVATLGRKMQGYVAAEGSDPRILASIELYPQQRSRGSVEFIEAPALPGYVARQREQADGGEFIVGPPADFYTLGADDVRAIFELMAEFWVQQTEHESALFRIFTHRAYRQILRMGRVVIPFLLERLSREPERWVPALAAITQQDPVPPGARAEEAVAAWQRWARSRGYTVSE